jgi:hypothetical protein
MDTNTIITLLILATLGISWSIVYLLIIYRSFKDQMCGMPAIVLAFNMFWEFLYSFVFLNEGQQIQIWVNRVWFLFDVVIFVSFIMYGVRNWETGKRRFFVPFVLFTLISAFSILYLMQLDFGEKAITYSAFLINVLMSASFIDLLLKHEDLKGQSFGIAFFKMLGTLAATIVLFQRYSQLLQLLGILCFVLDLIYIFMIVDLYKKANLHLITRRIKT